MAKDKSKIDIERILYETEGAYSRQRYGAVGWKKSIDNLAKLGYTEDDIILILNSKYMRWAADHYDEGKRYGELSGDEIVKYEEEIGIDLKGMYKEMQHHVSLGQYAGGGIPNNYEGNPPEAVWDAWTEDQRRHFFRDHIDKLPGYWTWNHILTQSSKSFEDIHPEVKQIVQDHVSEGQYASGGAPRLASKYIRTNTTTETRKLSPSEVWETWDRYQRLHFLKDHKDKIKIEEGWDLVYTDKSWDALPVDAKTAIEEHVVADTRYASGRGASGAKAGIPNNYKGKTAEQVWDAWTGDQRWHFAEDHELTDNVTTKTLKMNSSELKKDDWGEAFRHQTSWDWISGTLKEHIEKGSYAGGKAAGDKKTFILTDENLSKIDLSPLEEKVGQLIGVPVKFDVVRAIRGEYFEFTSSQNYVDQTGIFKSALKSATLRTFNSGLNENNDLWMTFTISYELINGGSNGVKILTAIYETNNNKWQFMTEKDYASKNYAGGGSAHHGRVEGINYENEGIDGYYVKNNLTPKQLNEYVKFRKEGAFKKQALGMALTTQKERENFAGGSAKSGSIIEKLKRAIASSKTPPADRDKMREALHKLQLPTPPPKPKPVKEEKKVKPIELPHLDFVIKNNIDTNKLPPKTRQKMTDIILLSSKKSDKARDKAKSLSEALIKLIKAGMKPSNKLNDRKKEEIRENYERRRKAKKELAD